MAFNISLLIVLFVSCIEWSVSVNCILENATKWQSSWDRRSRCYLEITCNEKDCKEELKMGLIDGAPYHTCTAYDHCGYLDNGLYCQCSLDFCSWNIKWLQELWKRSPTYDPDNEYHDLLEHYMDSQIARRHNASVRVCFWPGDYVIQSGRMPSIFHIWQSKRCQRFITSLHIPDYKISDSCWVDENDDINCYCNTDFCTSNFTRMMELWKTERGYNPSLESSKCLEKNAKAQEAYIRRVQGLPLESDEETTSALTLTASQPTTSTTVTTASQPVTSTTVKTASQPVTSTTMKPESTTITKAESSTTSPEKPYAKIDSAGPTTIFPRKSEDESQPESSKIYADKAKKVASDTAVLPILISVMGDLLIIVGGLLFWLYERQKYMETHKARGPVVKERSDSLLITTSKISPYKSKMAESDTKKTSAESTHKGTETLLKERLQRKLDQPEDQPRTRKKRSRQSPCANRVLQKLLLKFRRKGRRICHQLELPRNRDQKRLRFPNRYDRS